MVCLLPARRRRVAIFIHAALKPCPCADRPIRRTPASALRIRRVVTCTRRVHRERGRSVNALTAIDSGGDPDIQGLASSQNVVGAYEVPSRQLSNIDAVLTSDAPERFAVAHTMDDLGPTRRRSVANAHRPRDIGHPHADRPSRDRNQQILVDANERAA